MARELAISERRAWEALVRLWRVGVPQLDRILKRHGLIHVDYDVLSALSEQSEPTMSAGNLSSLTGVTSSRLSHRLTAMQKRQEILRHPAPFDARGVEIGITRIGRQRLAAAVDEYEAGLRNLVFEPLDPWQRVALADALSTIADRLTD